MPEPEEIEVTFAQQDPVTLHVRPIRVIMDQIAAIIQNVPFPAEVYDGTNLDDLTTRLASFLTRTRGKPAAIVCYGGSTFDNFPRRTSIVNVVIVSCDTRPTHGMPGALDASWQIAAALDHGVSEQRRKDDPPISDLITVSGEETVQLKNSGAACAIILQLTIKDF